MSIPDDVKGQISVTVQDDWSVWSKFKNELSDRLPLRDISLPSPYGDSGEMIVSKVGLEFQTFNEKLSWTSIEKWWKRPYVHLYMVYCADYESYKRLGVESRISAWLETVKKVAGSDASPLIIYVGGSTDSMAPKSPFRKIFGQMQKKFNDSEEICYAIRLGVDSTSLSGNSAYSKPTPVVPEEFTRDKDSTTRSADDSNVHELWPLLIAAMKRRLKVSYAARSLAYQEQIRALDQQRSLNPAGSSFPLSKMYLFKEGLAFVYRPFRIYGSVYGTYLEITSYLDSYPEQCKALFTAYGGTHPSQAKATLFSALSAPFRKAMIAQKTTTATANTVASTKAPPTSPSSLSPIPFTEFEFRQYLHARQTQALLFESSYVRAASETHEFILKTISDLKDSTILDYFPQAWGFSASIQAVDFFKAILDKKLAVASTSTSAASPKNAAKLADLQTWIGHLAMTARKQLDDLGQALRSPEEKVVSSFRAAKSLTTLPRLAKAIESHAAFEQEFKALTQEAALHYQKNSRSRFVTSINAELASVHYDLKEYEKAEPLYKSLVHMYSKDKWWELVFAVRSKLAVCQKHLHHFSDYIQSCLGQLTAHSHASGPEELAHYYSELRETLALPGIAAQPLIRPLPSFLQATLQFPSGSHAIVGDPFSMALSLQLPSSFPTIDYDYLSLTFIDYDPGVGLTKQEVAEFRAAASPSTSNAASRRSSMASRKKPRSPSFTTNSNSPFLSPGREARSPSSLSIASTKSVEVQKIEVKSKPGSLLPGQTVVVPISSVFMAKGTFLCSKMILQLGPLSLWLDLRSSSTPIIIEISPSSSSLDLTIDPPPTLIIRQPHRLTLRLESNQDEISTAAITLESTIGLSFKSTPSPESGVMAVRSEADTETTVPRLIDFAFKDNVITFEEPIHRHEVATLQIEAYAEDHHPVQHELFFTVSYEKPTGEAFDYQQSVNLDFSAHVAVYNDITPITDSSWAFTIQVVGETLIPIHLTKIQLDFHPDSGLQVDPDSIQRNLAAATSHPLSPAHRVSFLYIVNKVSDPNITSDFCEEISHASFHVYSKSAVPQDLFHQSSYHKENEATEQEDQIFHTEARIGLDPVYGIEYFLETTLSKSKTVNPFTVGDVIQFQTLIRRALKDPGTGISSPKKLGPTSTSTSTQQEISMLSPPTSPVASAFRRYIIEADPDLWIVLGKQQGRVTLQPGEEIRVEFSAMPLVAGYIEIPLPRVRSVLGLKQSRKTSPRYIVIKPKSSVTVPLLSSSSIINNEYFPPWFSKYITNNNEVVNDHLSDDDYDEGDDLSQEARDFAANREKRSLTNTSKVSESSASLLNSLMNVPSSK